VTRPWELTPFETALETARDSVGSELAVTEVTTGHLPFMFPIENTARQVAVDLLKSMAQPTVEPVPEERTLTLSEEELSRLVAFGVAVGSLTVSKLFSVAEGQIVIDYRKGSQVRSGHQAKRIYAGNRAYDLTVDLVDESMRRALPAESTQV